MAEGESMTDIARPADPVGRVLFAVSRAFAFVGGVLLTAMAAVTSISIIGRGVFSAPIPGDFEIASIGIGVAVFAFLPYCQMMRGNVIVDFFLVKAPVRVKAVCDAFGGILYLAIAAVLTWRMYFGALDMYRYSEKTMTIGFPRWSTFPISILCLTLLLAVVLYTIWRSVAEFRSNRFFDI
jgi:TRAP-type C4-dicarboxylate transport system permease small subunit